MANRGLVGRLNPARATRAIDLAIVCGACGRMLAERRGDLLTFPQDWVVSESFKGWLRIEHAEPGCPGGLWQEAKVSLKKQPPLSEVLVNLPTIIECSFCKVPNLFDPERLSVRPQQSLARAECARRRALFRSRASDRPRLAALSW